MVRLQQSSSRADRAADVLQYTPLCTCATRHLASELYCLCGCLYVCSDGGSSSVKAANSAIGHAGVGGTVGLCVPEKRVALAITVNKLSGSRTATKRLMDFLLAEVGLAAPTGL